VKTIGKSLFALGLLAVLASGIIQTSAKADEALRCFVECRPGGLCVSKSTPCTVECPPGKIKLETCATYYDSGCDECL